MYNTTVFLIGALSLVLASSSSTVRLGALCVFAAQIVIGTPVVLCCGLVRHRCAGSCAELVVLLCLQEDAVTEACFQCSTDDDDPRIEDDEYLDNPRKHLT